MTMINQSQRGGPRGLSPWVSTVTPSDTVIPDICQRESILVRFRMDPRLLIAAMTERGMIPATDGRG